MGGKYIEVKMPTESDSLSYNCKYFFQLVLMALVDANYCFIAVDIGVAAKSSDSKRF